MERSGLTREWFLGRAHIELVPPAERPGAAERFERVLGGETLPPQEILFDAGGRPYWVEISLTPVRHAGAITGVFGLSRQITLRKRFEEELRASEETLRTLVEALPHPILFVQDERLVYANAAAAEGLGATPGAGPADPRHRHITGDEGMETILALRNAIERGELAPPHRLQLSLRRRDGEPFPAELTIQSVTYRGRPATLYLVVDLTERERLEDQVRRSQKLEAVGTLAGGVAHDFNNILVGILGLAEILLSRSAPGDGVHEDAGEIARAARRGATLTRQLLGFARKGKILDVPVDLHRCVRDTAAFLRRTVDPRIRIEERLEAGLSTVRGDPGQMEQVVLNLAVNARDAMPDGGTLLLETRTAGPGDSLCASLEPAPHGFVVLAVSDTGAGIPAAARDRIFEPFYTTKTDATHSGMGLAVVYGIVDNHRGAIAVESEEGRGTRFSIALPVTPDAEPAPAPPAPCRPVQGRILLVDDEPVGRTVGQRLLASLGYAAVPAESGEAALGRIEGGERFDLVVLDLLMEGLSGREVFERLRARVPDLPVLICSGHGVEEVAQDLLARGAAGYLQKPYSKAELARAVADALAGGPDRMSQSP